MHVSHWISVFVLFFGKYPVVWLLDCRVVLYLIFWGTSILSSTVAPPICIPINNVRMFLFLYILSNTLLFLVLLILVILTGSRGIFYCSFDLHCPDGKWCWVVFRVSVGHLYILFGEMSVHVFFPFLSGLSVFGVLSCISSFFIKFVCLFVCLESEPARCSP